MYCNRGQRWVRRHNKKMNKYYNNCSKKSIPFLSLSNLYYNVKQAGVLTVGMQYK